jgi:hypothetical protein
MDKQFEQSMALAYSTGEYKTLLHVALMYLKDNNPDKAEEIRLHGEELAKKVDAILASDDEVIDSIISKLVSK